MRGQYLIGRRGHELASEGLSHSDVSPPRPSMRCCECAIIVISENRRSGKIECPFSSSFNDAQRSKAPFLYFLPPSLPPSLRFQFPPSFSRLRGRRPPPVPQLQTSSLEGKAPSVLLIFYVSIVISNGSFIRQIRMPKIKMTKAAQ